MYDGNRAKSFNKIVFCALDMGVGSMERLMGFNEILHCVFDLDLLLGGVLACFFSFDAILISTVY